MKENVLEVLLQKYSTFTKSEKKIADYILDNPKKTQYLGISELSNACKVADSTVSVFCKKLKLESFNAFKLALAKATMIETHQVALEASDITPDDSIEEIAAKILEENKLALQGSFDLLNYKTLTKAVDLLQKADHVICLGHGNHSVVARAAWSKFAKISPKFHSISDSHFQTIAVSQLKENDVVLFFSYSGTTLDFLNLVKTLKEKKVKIILVTRFLKGPGAEQADCVLIFGVNEKPLSFGSTAAIVAQLFIVDILFNEYFKQNYKDSSERLMFTAEALAQLNL